jgi:hypothetical protein
MSPRSHRRIWSSAALASLALAGVFAAGTSMASSPVAHASRTCAPPPYPGSGYFTSLRVTRVGCSTGKKLAVAYYKCRLRHGKTGVCHGRVLGYSCHEKRNSISTEIDARVTCTLGRRTIVHTYQQNL